MRTRVKLVLNTGLAMDARSLNLSTTGMAIVADGPIAANTQLVLRCVLPLSGAMHEFVASVRVVHSIYSSSEAGFVIGLVFQTLDPSINRLLAVAVAAPT